MPTDNVVDATSRFKGQGPEGERRPTPSALDRAVAELRSCARLQAADRPILASGLGRLAAQIMPNAPVKGAKMMFKLTGNGWESKWPKRRRLVRLPGEASDTTNDYGAFEGGGPAYLALADAAATIFTGNGTPGPRDYDKARREMLRGTSLMPQSTPLPASTMAARDLLSEWAERLCQRIGAETRLMELLTVLEHAPFETKRLDDAWGLVDGKLQCVTMDEGSIEAIRIEPAGQAALGASALWGSSDAVVRFCSTANDPNLGWANPRVRLGCLAGKVKIRTFVFPPTIANMLNEAEFNKQSDYFPEKLSEWFVKLGMDTTDKTQKYLKDWCEKSEEPYEWGGKKTFSKIPNIPWSKDTGFGWINFDYYRSTDVWLQIRRDDRCKVQVCITIDDLGDCPETEPCIPAFGKLWSLGAGDQKEIRIENGIVPLHFSGFDDGYFLLFWPEKSDSASSGGQIIGLIEHSIGEPFDDPLVGWLDDPEVAARLLTTDQWRFFPSITCPDGPVPCPTQCVAAALLRNLAGAPKELRVDDILITRANVIAQAGLAYHEALVDHYRSALLQP